MQKLGKFITFEGVDGAGKTVQVERTKNFLIQKGIKTIAIREPGSTEIGEKIRNLILENEMSAISETLMFFAARAELVQQIITPSLQAGTWVICDRFYDSTLVYQGVLKNFDIEKIMQLKFLTIGDLEPDLTIILNLSPEISAKRVAKRTSHETNSEKNKFDDMQLSYYKKISESYEKIADIFDYRAEIINANKSEEKVSESIKKILIDKFQI